MYKHYETSDDVFVDREEYIEWMDAALVRCKKKSVVLHLKGIGGIGKSSLLKHWIRTKERTVRVDCEHYTEFYNRLNVLAKGAVLQGVNLQRFDVLWQIRQRFVEGVEPVKEEGREWAKEVVMAIPFIGSLASIGSALSAVGTKVTPKLKGKYSTVGKWLQERLGKNHIERLLEILWKEPRHAEFLYVDALLEDINSRKDIDTPILFLLDHFEYVDSDNAQWKYQGKKITQTELWSIFLSSLTNCVGVMAGRKPAVKREDLELEETELTELDRESCIEMLELQGVTDKDLQEKIVSVSAGNPFVVDAICDMRDEGTIVLDDIECLRADTLEEVRLKTWRRLFNMAGDLQDIINRAGLLQFFDRDLLSIVAPSLTTDTWDRLLRLSFVRDRDDGTWVFHDLAYELIIAEMGPRIKSLTDEVAQLLEKRSEEDGDLKLMGHAFSVIAFSSEEEAIEKTKDLISGFLWRESPKDAHEILSNLIFRTVRGRAEHQGLLGSVLEQEARYAEAETTIKDAISLFEELAKKEFAKNGESLGFCYRVLGNLMSSNFRSSESEECFKRAIEIQRRLVSEDKAKYSEQLAESLALYGFLLANQLGPMDEGFAMAQEAVNILKQMKNQEILPWALNILGITQFDVLKRTAIYEEALILQRKLSAQEPDNTRHKALVAAIGVNLGHNLYLEGRIKEADEVIDEGVTIRRELADIEPDVYGWRFAQSLENYGEFLWRIREFGKAEKVLKNAFQLHENILEDEPGGQVLLIMLNLFFQARLQIVYGNASEANVAISNAIDPYNEFMEHNKESVQTKFYLAQNLAQVSSALYRMTLKFDEAEEAFKEAISILREYSNTSLYEEYVLAYNTNNYGAFYLSIDRVSKAKSLLEDATSVLKKHKEISMVSSRNFYAVSLCNLGTAYRKEGNLDEANRLYEESLGFFEGIVQKNPIRFQHNATLALNNYSLLLKEMGLFEKAESKLSEAIELQKKFAKEHPLYFEPILAISLNNQSILFSELDRDSDAIESIKNAIEIRRRLVKQSPEMYQVGLASSLHNHGILLRTSGKSTEADKVLREALEIWEQLREKAPEFINRKLAHTLQYLRITLLELGTREDEVKEIESRITKMGFEFSNDEELWLEEEEPIHIW